jgi:stearoyl-CoA desaturase (delta-9 desaturase)
MHHAHSDTEKDPHSPYFFKDIWRMMWHTRTIYNDIVNKKQLPDPQYTKEYLPAWGELDKIGDHMFVRIAFMVAYTLFYIFFAPNFWWFLLLPVHFLMGPIQGALVNWCGHKYGYSNFNNGDHSKNTEPFGIFLMGELFQNNHHKYRNNPNFANKWFELDPAYQVMRLLNSLGVIRLKNPTPG